MIFVKDLINVSIDKLTVKVNEEYLHCAAKDKFEFEISIELIIDIIKCVYNKIQEQKKIK